MGARRLFVPRGVGARPSLRDYTRRWPCAGRLPYERATAGAEPFKGWLSPESGLRAGSSSLPEIQTDDEAPAGALGHEVLAAEGLLHGNDAERDAPFGDGVRQDGGMPACALLHR